MAFNGKKYVRVSVDLTKAEYATLHRITEERGATKAAYVRRAIEEKMVRDEEKLPAARFSKVQ